MWTAYSCQTRVMEGCVVISTPKQAVLMSVVVLGGFSPLLDS
jgi:hypothetical protein